jgi:hypothetical protein
MSGTLRGNNQKADCTVSAVRVALSGTSLYKDCQYVIEWVSTTLAFGAYKLSVESKIIDMLYSKDGWRVLYPRKAQ